MAVSKIGSAAPPRKSGLFPRIIWGWATGNKNPWKARAFQGHNENIVYIILIGDNAGAAGVIA